MTDPSFPQPPSTPHTAPAAGSGARADVPVRIENVSGPLRDVSRAERLEGRVVRHNEDGSIRIRTTKGELDVRLREVPPEGQAVEVEIPPGHPPRQAVIRTAEAPPTAQPPTQPQAQASQTPAPATSTSAQPPLSNAVTRDLVTTIPTAPETKPPPQVTLQPGDIVRLTPLPPEEAAQIVQKTQELVSNLLEKMAPLPAAPATLLTPDKTATLSPAPTSPLENFLQQTMPPAQPGKPVLPQPASTDPKNLLGRLIAAPTLGGQMLKSALSSLLPSAAAPAQSAAPPITSLATPAPPPAAATPPGFDIMITSITPPPAPPGAPVLTPGLPPIASGMPSLPGKPGQPLSHPPATPVLPQTSAPVPGTLTAQVAGTTPARLPVFSLLLPGQEWPDHFVLQVEAGNLPAGSFVSFLPHTTPVAAGEPAPVAGLPLPFGIPGAFTWPALDELQKTLQQADPQIAQSLARTLIPNPAAAPTRMPPAVLFFLAAVRAGDISGWLGDKTIDIIRRAGRGDVLSRLSGDMEAAEKTGSEPAAQGWRSLTIPLYSQNEMQKMMLYYRQDRESDDPEQNKKRSTRFVFDMALNRMGPVQLDGLHREQRLDLIVRTKAPLSQAMQKTMRRTYIEALEQADVVGELSFQHRPEQWLRIDASAAG